MASHGRTLAKSQMSLLGGQILPHKYKRMNKSKYAASSTFLNSAEYFMSIRKNILVSLSKLLARIQQQ
jgi:hypothetical protein